MALHNTPIQRGTTHMEYAFLHLILEHSKTCPTLDKFKLQIQRGKRKTIHVALKLVVPSLVLE